MNKNLRLLSLILAIALFIAAFAACDSSQGSSETTDQTAAEGNDTNETTISDGSNSATESESVTEEATEPVAPRPETNYNDDFFLLIHNDSNRMEYHWVQEGSSDVLSQAIFDRQQKIYNHLGVNIVGTKAATTFNYIEPFKNAVKNKDGSIDMCLTHVYHGIDGFSSGGFLTDFRDIPGINLEADYWNLDVMEEVAWGGEKLFIAKSDFNILYTHCITFNKDIMDKYSDALDEDVYSLVENYRWTLDKMIEISNLVYIDKTGDGKTIDDTFGIAGECNVPAIGFMHASDISIISLNEKGVYELSLYNDLNKQKTTSLIEKLKALSDSDCAWLWAYQSGDNINIESGTSLLMLTSTNHLPNLLNYDLNFGVLPYPMYDEAQKDVGYRSLQWGGFTCVPAYVRNIEMVGDTLEMLSFYSDSVNEAFYEKLLGKQVAESPVDKRMLEIIWDGICTDFAQTYYASLSSTLILYVLPEVVKPGSNKNLASFVAGAEKSVNKILKKMALTSN